ncbi:MAG: AraC family transcriptional regulator [Pseudorhodobacter sp.]
MAKRATIFAPSSDPLSLAVLVLPQASILAVASTLDPMRSANRHLGHPAYRWRVLSPEGAPVPLTCGIELPSSGTLEQASGADALVVIAGFKQAEVATRPLIAALRRAAPRFSAIGAIDAGPWVLARAGLLDGYRATVHWEDFEDLAAAHPHIDVVPNRYAIDRNRFTAGGAAPAADMMLHLIPSAKGPPWRIRSRPASSPPPKAATQRKCKPNAQGSTHASPARSREWKTTKTAPNPSALSRARWACPPGGSKPCSRTRWAKARRPTPSGSALPPPAA